MSLFEFEIEYLEEQFSKLKIKHEETKVESIKLQGSYLGTSQKHHLLWAQSSEDPECAKIHYFIADLLKETQDQYQHLLIKKNQGAL